MGCCMSKDVESIVDKMKYIIVGIHFKIADIKVNLASELSTNMDYDGEIEDAVDNVNIIEKELCLLEDQVKILSEIQSKKG